MEIKPVNKSYEEIVLEWNNIAPLRLSQLSSNKDISHNQILLPAIKKLLENTNHSNVIDIGCGIGYDTISLSQIVYKITGIDISSKSVELAKLNTVTNVSFECISIEDYSNNHNDFTVAIANMVLMTTPNLDVFIKSVAKILKPNSHFIFTIPHPWFWPFYWNYADEIWFDYNKEIQIESNFSISNQKESNFKTTHIHRPLNNYLNLLITNGFTIEIFIELFPNEYIHSLYLEKWKYPRFIAIKCKYHNLQ